MKCLVQNYPQENNCGSHGHVGKNRRLVSPGHSFDGRESIIGVTHPSGEWFRDTTQSTGWYTPLGWVSEDEAVRLVAENLWDSAFRSDVEWGEWIPSQKERMEKARRAVKEFFLVENSDAFPGLATHYGELPDLSHDMVLV